MEHEGGKVNDEGESDDVVDERTGCILERLYEIPYYKGSAFNVPR
jgi:hypothetical protein